jgi:hypothetical protein
MTPFVFGTSKKAMPAPTSAKYAIISKYEDLDGNTNTRWSSRQGHDPEWIYENVFIY